MKKYLIKTALFSAAILTAFTFLSCKEGKKKYVRYAEGAELYSRGLHTFESLAKEAKATRKVKGVVLCNTEKIDAFIESFDE